MSLACTRLPQPLRTGGQASVHSGLWRESPVAVKVFDSPDAHFRLEARAVRGGCW
jgi:hypothetical protein